MVTCLPCTRGYHPRCAGQSWLWVGTRLAAVPCACTSCTRAVAA